MLSFTPTHLSFHLSSSTLRSGLPALGQSPLLQLPNVPDTPGNLSAPFALSFYSSPPFVIGSRKFKNDSNAARIHPLRLCDFRAASILRNKFSSMLMLIL